MVDSFGKPRAPKTTISLPSALASLGVDARWSFHNSGNDAFSCLLALQMLIDRNNTNAPNPSIPRKGRNAEINALRTPSRSPGPMGVSARKSLPIVPPHGIGEVGMNTTAPSRGTAGNYRVPNEPGSVRQTPGRPASLYTIGPYNRNSSTGDLLSSMQNLRTS